MGELAEEEKQLAVCPPWVPEYLAAWGSTRPDGKAMSVVWAAGLVGVTPDAVRQLRKRNRQFRTLEYLARRGGQEFMASYADAGIRSAAPRILRAFLRLLDEGEYHAILQGMKWLMNKPDSVNLNMRGAIAQGDVDDWGDLSDDELDQVIANLEAAAGGRPSGATSTAHGPG